MSSPVWDLPRFLLEHVDLPTLCMEQGCAECAAEPGEMPWVPAEGEGA